MIHLDEHDLPVSRDDAMDSCVRESIMTLAGVVSFKIRLYEKDGLGVRHPYEVPANNPLNFTNDQSIMLVAALHAAGNVAAIRRMFWAPTSPRILTRVNRDRAIRDRMVRDRGAARPLRRRPSGRRLRKPSLSFMPTCRRSTPDATTNSSRRRPA